MDYLAWSHDGTAAIIDSDAYWRLLKGIQLGDEPQFESVMLLDLLPSTPTLVPLDVRLIKENVNRVDGWLDRQYEVTRTDTNEVVERYGVSIRTGE